MKEQYFNNKIRMINILVFSFKLNKIKKDIKVIYQLQIILFIKVIVEVLTLLIVFFVKKD